LLFVVVLISFVTLYCICVVMRLESATDNDMNELQ